jgi:hypothetical protein
MKNLENELEYLSCQACPGTNALAYLVTFKARKKKSFFNIDANHQGYKTFFRH